MKTFSLCVLLSFGIFLGVNAQEKSYTPNARQAVQKSRMQQPQYMEVTQPKEVKASESQAKTVKAAASAHTVNYQIERPVAIEAPKRRGKKSAEGYTRLASNKK